MTSRDINKVQLKINNLYIINNFIHLKAICPTDVKKIDISKKLISNFYQ